MRPDADETGTRRFGEALEALADLGFVLGAAPALGLFATAACGPRDLDDIYEGNLPLQKVYQRCHIGVT